MADWYVMNPAEDAIMRGPELAEGMLILGESAGRWSQRDMSNQTFSRIAELDRAGEVLLIRAEWPDGYQETRSVHESHTWLVKKSSIPDDAPRFARVAQADLDQLLAVATLYVKSFSDDEMMTLPEKMRLQAVEGILARHGERH